MHSLLAPLSKNVMKISEDENVRIWHERKIKKASKMKKTEIKKTKEDVKKKNNVKREKERMKTLDERRRK